MTKPSDQDRRLELPPGWDWADWDGAADARAFWQAEAHSEIRERFRPRLQYISLGIQTGDLRAELGYFEDGIYVPKITRPNPGWRGWAFREGGTMFITHFSAGTSKKDHKGQMNRAKAAREQHLARRSRRAR